MSEPTAPHVPALPAVRRQALRHHLMSEIGRPVRRPRRMLVLAPAAGVLTAVVAAGVVTQPWAPDSAPLVVEVAPGEHGGAALLLNRMAEAAGDEPGPTSGEGEGEGEYVYIRSRGAYAELGDGPARLQPVRERELWIPRYEPGEGLLREPRFDGPLSEVIPRQSRLDDVTPNAAFVDLPTDPDALLAKLYQERGERGRGNSRDGAAFTAIGDILRESLVPPQTSAALYRAAAKIPGVEMVRGVTDAAGRRGIAVGHTELDRRDEWIFDERTYEYLGERSYLVADTPDGPAGTVLGTTAVLQRAVVSTLGERPER
ncbi:CU044_5270 family protein [Micromonospora sp. WMMD961]|uniref:CU044_5270 family protein n=1 Tax=Micromonospora sp. WMMD961 TaxID=3016100 RepID=UPI0024180E31|nr:CU044_5270 family protein [Micromonospora sp. WMMD961]MDG4781397.1 CU044_5270 family protein [Micromonospora sp. WMMD961]